MRSRTPSIVFVPREIHARLHVAQLARLQIDDAEHQAASAFIGRDDGGLAEPEAHARTCEAREEETERDDERDRSDERLEVREPVGRRTEGVHHAGARGREHADAERERAEEWILESHVLGAAKRTVAKREVGEREEAVQEEQHAHHPPDERGPARVERGEIEARGALCAETVLLAVRLSVAVQEATADGLGDDAAEAEIGDRFVNGRRRRSVHFLGFGGGHATLSKWIRSESCANDPAGLEKTQAVAAELPWSGIGDPDAVSRVT